MKFEDDSAVQVGSEVYRSQGAARAISVCVHIFTGDRGNLLVVVH